MIASDAMTLFIAISEVTTEPPVRSSRSAGGRGWGRVRVGLRWSAADGMDE